MRTVHTCCSRTWSCSWCSPVTSGIDIHTARSKGFYTASIGWCEWRQMAFRLLHTVTFEQCVVNEYALTVPRFVHASKTIFKNSSILFYQDFGGKMYQPSNMYLDIPLQHWTRAGIHTFLFQSYLCMSLWINCRFYAFRKHLFQFPLYKFFVMPGAKQYDLNKLWQLNKLWRKIWATNFNMKTYINMLNYCRTTILGCEI